MKVKVWWYPSLKTVIKSSWRTVDPFHFWVMSINCFWMNHIERKLDESQPPHKLDGVRFLVSQTTYIRCSKLYRSACIISLYAWFDCEKAFRFNRNLGSAAVSSTVSDWPQVYRSSEVLVRKTMLVHLQHQRSKPIKLQRGGRQWDVLFSK